MCWGSHVITMWNVGGSVFSLLRLQKINRNKSSREVYVPLYKYTRTTDVRSRCSRLALLLKQIELRRFTYCCIRSVDVCSRCSRLAQLLRLLWRRLPRLCCCCCCCCYCTTAGPARCSFLLRTYRYTLGVRI